MAISVVKATEIRGTASPYSGPVSATAGNALIVGADMFYSASPSAPTVTRTGDTYTNDISGNSDASESQAIASAPNVAGGSVTMTVTGGTNAQGGATWACEVSGLPSSGIRDATSPSINAGNSATAASKSLTNATATAIFFAFAYDNSGNNPASISPSATGWSDVVNGTTMHELNGSTYDVVDLAYIIVSSVGAQTCTWTNTNATWGANIAVYKGASGSQNFSENLSFTSGNASSLVRGIGYTKSLTEGASTALQRGISVTLPTIGEGTAVPSVPKTIGKSLTLIEASNSQLVRNISPTISVVGNTITSIGRGIGKRLAFAEGAQVLLVKGKGFFKTILVTTGSVSSGATQIIVEGLSSTFLTTQGYGQPSGFTPGYAVSLLKNVGKTLPVTEGTSATFARALTITRTITVAAGSAVGLLRNIGKHFNFTEASQALVANRQGFFKTIQVSEGASITVNRVASYARNFLIAEGNSAKLVRNIGKTILVAPVVALGQGAGEVIRQGFESLLVASQGYGSSGLVGPFEQVFLIRNVTKTIGVGVTSVVTFSDTFLGRAITILVQEGTSTSLGMLKAFNRTFAIGAGTTTSLVRGITRTLKWMATSTVSLARGYARTLNFTSSAVASLGRQASHLRSFLVAEGTATSLSRQASYLRTIQVTGTSTASLARNLARTISVNAGSLVGATYGRFRFLTVLFSAPTAPSLGHILGKTFAISVGSSVSLISIASVSIKKGLAWIDDIRKFRLWTDDKI